MRGFLTRGTRTVQPTLTESCSNCQRGPDPAGHGQEQGCRLLFQSHAVNPSRGPEEKKQADAERLGSQRPNSTDSFGDRTEQTCPKSASSSGDTFWTNPAVGAHTEDPYQIRVLLKANSGWPLRDQTKGRPPRSLCLLSTSQEGTASFRTSSRSNANGHLITAPSPKWPLS